MATRSIPTLLKSIVLTSFDLGKAQIRETFAALVTQAKESRAAELLETARQRISRTESAHAITPRRATRPSHA